MSALLNCDYCGSGIYNGQEYLAFNEDAIPSFKGLVFCCYECYKKHMEHNLDDACEDLMERYDAFDGDYGALYGVHDSDFV